MNVTLANEFNSKILPFSVFKFVQSITIFAFLMIESNFNDSQAFTIYYICVAVFALVAQTMMFFFKFKEKNLKSET